MVGPTVMLWIGAVAIASASAFTPHGDLPPRAEMAARVAFPLIVSWWVLADARKRRRQLFYDYDTLVFFIWPFVVPAYLFKTRGARAFLTLLCFVGIWVVAAVAAFAVSMIW